MSRVHGFKTPQDLLQKLYRERDRLYAALGGYVEEEVADAIFNFSITAYSIRDWIRKSKGLEQELQSLFKGSPHLRACRDICNESKHFELDYDPETIAVSVSPSPPLEGRAGPGRVNVKMSDGSRFEIFEWANDVVETWEKFFSDHGL